MSWRKYFAHLINLAGFLLGSNLRDVLEGLRKALRLVHLPIKQPSQFILPDAGLIGLEGRSTVVVRPAKTALRGSHDEDWGKRWDN